MVSKGYNKILRTYGSVMFLRSWAYDHIYGHRKKFSKI